MQILIWHWLQRLVPDCMVLRKLGAGTTDQRQCLRPSSIPNIWLCQKHCGILPRHLKASEAARALFGDAFVDHFAATREWEEREFRKHITDWELERYFEII